jgi:hypothetical protein
MPTPVSHVLLFLVGVRRLAMDVASQCEVHDRRGHAGLMVVVAQWPTARATRTMLSSIPVHDRLCRLYVRLNIRKQGISLLLHDVQLPSLVR